MPNALVLVVVVAVVALLLVSLLWIPRDSIDLFDSGAQLRPCHGAFSTLGPDQVTPQSFVVSRWFCVLEWNRQR